MKAKLLLASFCLFLGTAFIFISAQEKKEKEAKPFKVKQINVYGIVTDEAGKALPEALISFPKDSRFSFPMRKDGSYSILILNNDSVIFECSGYISQMVYIENRNEINVKLKTAEAKKE